MNSQGILMTKTFDNYIISPNISEFNTFKPPLRLAVMASGNGTNFEILVKASLEGTLDIIIDLLIVSNNNCKVIDKAKKYNINYIVMDQKFFKNKECFEENIIDVLNDHLIEGIVMAGWMKIVSNKLINSFQGKLINIHPSILPSFKGKDAIDQAISSKVFISGCTVHYVTEEVDSGDIIIQSAVPINPIMPKAEIHKIIQQQEHKILPIAVSIAGKKWRELNTRY